MRDPVKLSLLDHLGDTVPHHLHGAPPGMIWTLHWDPKNPNMKSNNSKPFLSQSWKNLSRTTETKSPHKQRHYTRSYKPYPMQTLRNRLSEQHLRNTCSTLTSLQPSKWGQNDREHKPEGNKLQMSSEPEMSTMGFKEEEEPIPEHLSGKWNTSYKDCERNSHAGSITEAPLYCHPQIMTQSWVRVKESQTRRNVCTNCTYHGTLQNSLPKPAKSTRTEKRLERHSQFSRRTSPLPSKRFDEPLQPRRVSKILSGSTSSEERPSTLMSSSATYIMLPLLRRILATSEEQRFLLEKQIQHKRSKQVETGPLPGMLLLKQLNLHFHTEERSCSSGQTTWPQNSQLSMPTPITNFLPLTKQSEPWSVEGKLPCSLTELNSPSYTQPTSFPMGSREA